MKLIKNAQILDNGELKQASILIDGQHIKEINNNIEVDENVEVIDAQGNFVSDNITVPENAKTLALRIDNRQGSEEFKILGVNIFPVQV